MCKSFLPFILTKFLFIDFKLLPFFHFLQIANLNDNDLKSLLDEAMNYKNPQDILNKSETFKVSWNIASYIISREYFIISLVWQ